VALQMHAADAGEITEAIPIEAHHIRECRPIG
jgi:hypothetical protein